MAAYIRKYTSLLQHLQRLEILEAYQLKPLIDGKDLAKAMSMPTGPWMKDALDVVMAWQLRTPGQTEPAAAVEEVKKHGELAFSLAQHFLKLTICPLFQKSKPTTLTDNARIHKTTTTARNHPHHTDDEFTKPWKHASNYNVLLLLGWSVKNISETAVRQLWPLVIPPVLTLIDDWETKYKRLGCQLLNTTLLKTQPLLLQQTGLSPVFEEALAPALTYIPPLLKDEEASTLLPDVYQTLITLAEKSYNNSKDTSRADALDVIIRKGIIYGYAHASEFPAVTNVLLQQLSILTNKLGILSVKHLKFVIPMLVEVLSSSHATGRPDLLHNASVCLHSVLRNCWPRIFAYHGDILKGITLCWLNLEDSGILTDELCDDLRANIKLLKGAVAEEVAFADEAAFLIAADKRLSSLFEM